MLSLESSRGPIQHRGHGDSRDNPARLTDGQPRPGREGIPGARDGVPNEGPPFRLPASHPAWHLLVGPGRNPRPALEPEAIPRVCYPRQHLEPDTLGRRGLSPAKRRPAEGTPVCGHSGVLRPFLSPHPHAPSSLSTSAAYNAVLKIASLDPTKKSFMNSWRNESSSKGTSLPVSPTK